MLGWLLFAMQNSLRHTEIRCHVRNRGYRLLGPTGLLATIVIFLVPHVTRVQDEERNKF